MLAALLRPLRRLRSWRTPPGVRRTGSGPLPACLGPQQPVLRAVGLLSLPQEVLERVYNESTFDAKEALGSTCHVFRQLWRSHPYFFDGVTRPGAQRAQMFYAFQRAACKVAKRLAFNLQRLGPAEPQLIKATLTLDEQQLGYIMRMRNDDLTRVFPWHLGHWVGCRLEDWFVNPPHAMVLSLTVRLWSEPDPTHAELSTLELLFGSMVEGISDGFSRSPQAHLTMASTFWVATPPGKRYPLHLSQHYVPEWVYKGALPEP